MKANGKVYEAENEESGWKETADVKAPPGGRRRAVSLLPSGISD